MFAYIWRQLSDHCDNVCSIYPLEIAMYHSHAVKISETMGNINELFQDEQNWLPNVTVDTPTRSKRSAVGLVFKYAVTFPFGIQGLRIQRGKSVVSMPMNGVTLG